MLNVFKQACLLALEKAAEKLYSSGLDLKKIEKNCSVPPSFDQGQFALPCFVLAKDLKKSPQTIAQELALAITPMLHAVGHGSEELRAIGGVQSLGGYLNFYMNFSYCAKNIYDKIEVGEFFSYAPVPKEEQECIHVEYSQPNTHKALHVGHLRCLVLGDAVARVLQRAGHRVIKATYPGDLGAHVAKVLWFIHSQGRSVPKGESLAHWLGYQYAEADGFLKDLSPEAQSQAKSEIAAVLAELQQRKGQFFDLYAQTRQWSLEFMRQTYEWLGVTFDQWFYESECDEPSRQLVLEYLEKGLFVKDAGAVGVDLSEQKLGFALLLKSDGNGLYLTKDLELMRRKFSDPKVTRSIVVVDARQKLHFQQVFKIGELMGYEGAKRSIHVSYETVNTSDGKPFSSREKSGTDLWDLKQRMETEVVSRYLNQYRGQWPDQEIQLTAQQVSIGALKYGMLRVDSQTKITFQLDEWLRLDGDTGPYLQYVLARCSSLIKKLNADPKAIPPVPVLERPEEQELLFQLYGFWRVVDQAAELYKPHLVANYLYDLCKMFNRFYENCPVRGAEQNVLQSRVSLIHATASVLRYGLQEILGIPTPERM